MLVLVLRTDREVYNEELQNMDVASTVGSSPDLDWTTLRPKHVAAALLQNKGLAMSILDEFGRIGPILVSACVPEIYCLSSTLLTSFAVCFKNNTGHTTSLKFSLLNGGRGELFCGNRC